MTDPGPSELLTLIAVCLAAYVIYLLIKLLIAITLLLLVVMLLSMLDR